MVAGRVFGVHPLHAATLLLVRPDSSIHWSAYPALFVAGVFALGVVGASIFESRALLPWLGGVGGGVVLFLGVQWWDRVRLVTLAPLGRMVAILLIVGCVGGARHAMYQAPSPRALSQFAEASEEEATLQGSVVNAPERTDDATRFTLEVDSVFGQDTASVEGRTRVTLRSSPWAEETSPFPVIHQGDVIRLSGMLRSAPGLRNPGGFDYGAYLARRGVCCTLYVGEPEHVAVRGDRRGSVGRGLVAIRKHIRHQLDRYVPSAGGRAVLRALLLGDRSRVTDAQRDRFAKTGLMHLLAVSGLHVFLVGMVLHALLRPFLMRFRLQWKVVEIVRAGLTIVVLGFYMLLTGGRPSVVRAVIMATLFIGGIYFQRSTHPLNTLGVAAVILLAVRPPALFDAGFQLSMAAVAGIVTLNPRFVEMVPERYRTSEIADWGVSTVTVSAAAILGTAPVLLYHFGWVSVAGLLLNVVGIPCTGLALSAAILAVGIGEVWALAGVAFGSAADLFVQGLLATSRYGAAWFSWAGLRMAVSDLWVLGAVVAGLVALAQWPRPRNRWRWIAAGLLLATVSIWKGSVGRDSGAALDVVFFDVGQGDAALIATPGGQHMLVDTGPRSPEGGGAEFVILPYLERWGIRRLDVVAITHPDEDHLGGLPTLLEETSVGRVVHNGRPADTELYAETERLLDQKGGSQQTVQRGDTISVGSDVWVQVLSPPDSSRRRIRGRNNASLVLHVGYGGTDFLFSGDIEADAEKDLVRAYGAQIESRVVTIPHHGSSTSSTDAFVRAASGEDMQESHAVVSVGRNGQYGMPNEEVLARWAARGTNVHSTAREGAVWMRSDGKRVWRLQWKGGSQ